jgi:chaperonin GroEL
MGRQATMLPTSPGMRIAQPAPMAHTRLIFRDQAREKILAGVAALADAVRITLGPKAKSILIEKKFGSPIVCDDGVTIARTVNLPRPRSGVEGRRRVAAFALEAGDEPA